MLPKAVVSTFLFQGTNVARLVQKLYELRSIDRSNWPEGKGVCCELHPLHACALKSLIFPAISLPKEPLNSIVGRT